VRPASEPAVDRVPEDFIHLVQDALGHLHDPSHLQTHPLTRLTPNQEGAGRALRARLLAAVEKLRPAREGEQLGRAYQILRLRYVEGLTPRQVQDRLGVAKSQYYLDSARAVAALASLLWEELGPVAPEGQATLAVTPTVGSHLARPWTSFVGRERELEQLLKLLSGSGSASRPRLVTLVGPGGVGKTRLALECAAALQWRDGVPVCFVELASLHDPSLVLPTLATTLGLQEVAGRPLLDVLNEHLSEAELLLILDNLEHVIGVANDIAQLLLGCPHLQVLATSRMPLNVYGEQEVVVPPLATGQPNRAALEPGPAEHHSLFNLGYVAADDGDLVTARAYLDESLSLMNELGDPRGLAWALEGFAQVAAPGQPERAVRLAGAAERLREDAGARMPSTATERFERVLAPVRLRLSADTWAAEWVAGRSMGLDEALAEARGTEC
jgi:AAA ATPase domain